MVFHLQLNKITCVKFDIFIIIVSHLHCIKLILSQCKTIVKVHRVFPSYHKISASSQKIQFHWDNIGDSREVVTPFMRDGTYPTFNYATLGPS